ncbi:hypothetical protein J2W51_001564 [Tardiphaga robiniae]|uniref:hypothetical protein n=1 Tax=Tardiphaga robiniae TaxID=943830 RepID=UPI0028603F0D|nr:hypothetical protein [Tardiphaga robiniae]MDR6659022.1 hypothetical protein [Tardiphaga robiniae]
MRKKNTNDVEALSMWATDILLEAHAIAPCPDHAYLRLRHSHHAVDYARSIAEHRKFSGKNKEQRVKAVEEVLDSLADTCPACE